MIAFDGPYFCFMKKQTMRAVDCSEYGAPEVLQIVTLEIPEPAKDELLIRVHSTSVNSGDVRMRKADPWAIRLIFGFKKPRHSILGTSFSGEVVKIGENVRNYQIGDSVFGSTGMRFGTYAEYLCLQESATLSLKPESISHSEAATIPFGGTTALHFIQKSNIQSGQKVLIYGASGAVGSAAMQLAKSKGAVVTAVCSGLNGDLMKELGADHVIDYTKEDFFTLTERYDVIYEAVNKLSFSKSILALKKNGVLILGAAGFPQMLRAGFARMTGCNILTGVIKESAAEMIVLKDLVDSGQFKPVVDCIFPLEEIAEAHRYVDLGHKRGNVAIRVLE